MRCFSNLSPDICWNRWLNLRKKNVTLKIFSCCEYIHKTPMQSKLKPENLLDQCPAKSIDWQLYPLLCQMWKNKELFKGRRWDGGRQFEVFDMNNNFCATSVVVQFHVVSSSTNPNKHWDFDVEKMALNPIVGDHSNIWKQRLERSEAVITLGISAYITRYFHHPFLTWRPDQKKLEHFKHKDVKRSSFLVKSHQEITKSMSGLLPRSSSLPLSTCRSTTSSVTRFTFLRLCCNRFKKLASFTNVIIFVCTF